MSPRSSEQWDEMREQSRAKILEAALELFGSQGYHATSITQIAKQAGISKGLMYNYFDSKEELMEALVFGVIAHAEEALEQVKQLPDPTAQLTAIIEGSFAYLDAHRHQASLMGAVSLQLEHFPQLKTHMQGRYEVQISYFESLMAARGFAQPRQEAMFLAAAMDGLGIQSFLLDNQADVETMKHFLLARYVGKSSPQANAAHD